MQEMSSQEARNRAAAYADEMIRKLDQANSYFPNCPEPIVLPSERKAAFFENHLRFLEQHYKIKE